MDATPMKINDARPTNQWMPFHRNKPTSVIGIKTNKKGMTNSASKPMKTRPITAIKPTTNKPNILRVEVQCILNKHSSHIVRKSINIPLQYEIIFHNRLAHEHVQRSRKETR